MGTAIDVQDLESGFAGPVAGDDAESLLKNEIGISRAIDRQRRLSRREVRFPVVVAAAVRLQGVTAIGAQGRLYIAGRAIGAGLAADEEEDAERFRKFVIDRSEQFVAVFLITSGHADHRQD